MRWRVASNESLFSKHIGNQYNRSKSAHTHQVDVYLMCMGG